MIVETEPPLLRVSIGIDFHAVVSSRNHGGIGRQSDFEIVGWREGAGREVDFFYVCSYLPTVM